MEPDFLKSLSMIFLTPGLGKAHYELLDIKPKRLINCTTRKKAQFHKGYKLPST